MRLQLYTKQLLILTAALLLNTLFTVPVWAENQTKTINFKNVTIESLGNQSYDTKTNILTNMGHARMTIDNVVLEADSLTYYGNENTVSLSGNVLMIKNTESINADHLTLNMNTGWLKASGAVKMSNPDESFSMETINYNLNKDIGEAGPSIQGIVKGRDKDFYVTGKTAKFESGTVTITPATITRCPRKDYSDYIFAGKKMIIQGKHVYMENVVFKIMSIPLLYLPHMALRGESLPRINLSANQGAQTDLNEVITKSEASDTQASNTQAPNSGVETTKAESPSPTPAPKSKKVRISPNISGEINTNDKPSQVTVGRIYEWNRYSDEVDLNFDSEGIFSLYDLYQINWNQYNLAIDGKTDLDSDPKRELGMTFTKNAWKTNYGNWQVALFSRLLYEKTGSTTYQGIDGGYRLDYQLTPDFNLSYLYIQNLSGTTQDWEQLERKFLLINGYRLGGNFIYGMKIPLSPHYFILNTGTYNFRDNEWVSQVIDIAREVDCLKYGIGWDFAKNYIDLTFRLNY